MYQQAAAERRPGAGGARSRMTAAPPARRRRLCGRRLPRGRRRRQKIIAVHGTKGGRQGRGERGAPRLAACTASRFAGMNMGAAKGRGEGYWQINAIIMRCWACTKDASEDEIKKAYRKLAKKYHPDLNPGDKDSRGTNSKRSTRPTRCSVRLGPSARGTTSSATRASTRATARAPAAAAASEAASAASTLGDIFDSFFGGGFGGFGGGGVAAAQPQRPDRAATTSDVIGRPLLYGGGQGLQTADHGPAAWKPARPAAAPAPKRAPPPRPAPTAAAPGRCGSSSAPPSASCRPPAPAPSAAARARSSRSPAATAAAWAGCAINKTLEVTVPAGIDDGQTFVLRGPGRRGAQRRAVPAT